MALRGDPPRGSGVFEPHPEGFASSVELVSALAEMEQFEIWVGAYPEKHPEAADQAADIAYLKRKLDAGATGAITQFFFENESFLRFRDACVAAGIEAPILPGILPIDDFDRICGFAERCHTNIPDWMHQAYGHAEDDESHDLLSVAIATEQCDELFGEGVEQVHLYTLNKPELPWSVAQALGFEAHPMKIAASCG